MEGSFEANPPFVRAVMTAMAEKMALMLRNAEERNRALSFAVFLPGWTDEPAWKILDTSVYLRKKVVIAKEEHGFCKFSIHHWLS